MPEREMVMEYKYTGRQAAVQYNQMYRNLIGQFGIALEITKADHIQVYKVKSQERAPFPSRYEWAMWIRGIRNTPHITSSGGSLESLVQHFKA